MWSSREIYEVICRLEKILEKFLISFSRRISPPGSSQEKILKKFSISFSRRISPPGSSQEKILKKFWISFSRRISPPGSSQEKNYREILDFFLETNFSTWVVSRKKLSRNSWFLSRDEFLHLGRLKKKIIEKFLISFSRRISLLGSSREIYEVICRLEKITVSYVTSHSKILKTTQVEKFVSRKKSRISREFLS